MSSLRLMSLLYAATFLPSSASADAAVSLDCNATVEVAAGETASLSCSIKATNKDFVGTKCVWCDGTAKVIPCGSKYKCEWDNRTYVSLTISNVSEEDTYTVDIIGTVGRANSSIKVHVTAPAEDAGPTPPSTKHEFPLAIGLLCIFISVIALGILYFLFGTGRGRKIMNAIRKEKTQEDHRDVNSAPGSEDSLTA